MKLTIVYICPQLYCINAIYTVEWSSKLYSSVRAWYFRLAGLGHPPREKSTARMRGHSDTGNRTPGYRVRDDNASHYTISDMV